MIKTPISGQLECLQLANIHHSLFISHDKCELHLWDSHKLTETLVILESLEIKVDSIVRMQDAQPDDMFYIMHF